MNSDQIVLRSTPSTGVCCHRRLVPAPTIDAARLFRLPLGKPVVLGLLGQCLAGQLTAHGVALGGHDLSVDRHLTAKFAHDTRDDVTFIELSSAGRWIAQQGGSGKRSAKQFHFLVSVCFD